MKDNREAYEALMKVYPLTTGDLDGEVWRKVDEHYHVSNFGRVKSFWSSKARILKPQMIKDGYLRTHLKFNGGFKGILVHRLVAQVFIPNPNDKPEVNHLDGNKLNNCVGNLEWVTRSENNRHAYSAGLNPSGEDNVLSKLTNAQAEEILHTFIPGDEQFGIKALAEKFGVTAPVITCVLRGKTYRNVEGERRTAKFYHKTLSISQMQFMRDNFKPFDRNFGLRALAEKFGVCESTAASIIHDQTAGNYHAPIKRKYLTEAEKDEIRRIYKAGDQEFGAKPLALKYGVNRSTIRRIVGNL